MATRETDLKSERFFKISTPSSSAKELFLYPQTGSLAVCTGEYCRSRSSYMNYNLAYIRKGQLLLTVPSGDYILRPGEAYMIETARPHIYCSYKGQEVEMLWLHFNGRLMPEYYSYITRGDQNNVFTVSEGFEFRFYALIENLASATVWDEMKVSAHIMELLSDLQGGAPQTDTQVEKAIRYIEKHFSETITLEDLSRVAHLSVSHFCACFKRVVGMSPYQYIIDTRLNAARHLLFSSGLTVEEVACEAGFGSVSSFIKTYSRKYGVTPGRNRKQDYTKRTKNRRGRGGAGPASLE